MEAKRGWKEVLLFLRDKRALSKFNADGKEGTKEKECGFESIGSSNGITNR